MKKLILTISMCLSFDLAQAGTKSNFYIKPKAGQYYALTEKSDLDLPNMKICLTERNLKQLNAMNEKAKKTCVEKNLVDTPKYLKTEVVCDKNQKLIFEKKYISENKYIVIQTFEGKTDTLEFTYSGSKCDPDAVTQYL